MTDATALFTESSDLYTTQEEAMLEVISTARELTMLCAKM